ncbi:acyl-CoA dehydrogenase N-terminal domain-containing protein, partial [Pseudomonas sp. B9(2017)]
MSDYQAPLRDMQFILNEVFEASKLWGQFPALHDFIDSETAEAILNEAGKLAAEVLAPLNRPGDEQGCQWQDGRVTTPQGFVEAYRAFSEGGWG